MDYNHITDFLGKFKKILFQKEEIYKLLSEVISSQVSFLIKTNEIKIKNTIIYIDGSPTLKNEILMHKKTILSKIKEVAPNYNFTDIK